MKAAVSLICLLLVGGCGAAGGPDKIVRPAAFTLNDLGGKPHALSEYRDKVVVLNFWATWCIPCRAEMPDLEHEYRAHKNDGLMILGIDWEEDPAAAAKFVAEYQISYPVLSDRDGKVYAAYNIAALPETFVLARDPMLYVADRRTGITSRERLETQLVPLLRRS